MRMKLSNLPEDFLKKYKLTAKTTKDVYSYIKMCKGMYRIPQAGILAHKLLYQRLNYKGYMQSRLIPGYWKHNWRPIYFTLFVNDFVPYVFN